MMITLKVLTRLDAVLHRYAKVFDLYIEFDSNKNVSLFLQKMRELSVKVETLEMTKGKGPDKVPGAVISVEILRRDPDAGVCEVCGGAVAKMSPQV